MNTSLSSHKPRIAFHEPPLSVAGSVNSSSSLGGGGPTGWTICRMSWALTFAVGSFWARAM